MYFNYLIRDKLLNLVKIAKVNKDMPSFLKQDRPKKVKEIYKALKRDHPEMSAEMKARIAARQGKPGKQHQGPPYKGPITKESSYWIQKAINRPGALHKQLGIPENKKIPNSVLRSAADKGGKLGMRARLALTLKRLHK